MFAGMTRLEPVLLLCVSDCNNNRILIARLHLDPVLQPYALVGLFILFSNFYTTATCRTKRQEVWQLYWVCAFPPCYLSQPVELLTPVCICSLWVTHNTMQGIKIQYIIPSIDATLLRHKFYDVCRVSWGVTSRAPRKIGHVVRGAPSTRSTTLLPHTRRP